MYVQCTYVHVRAFVYHPLNKEKTNAKHVVANTRRFTERIERDDAGDVRVPKREGIDDNERTKNSA